MVCGDASQCISYVTCENYNNLQNVNQEIDEDFDFWKE